jgi:uncharacterized protein
MKYANFVSYTTDKSKIAAHRPAHREYLSRLIQQGKLMAAGPFADDSGALFVYEAASGEAAAALVAEDPFSINGVFQSTRLKPWKIVFSNPELFRSDS